MPHDVVVVGPLSYGVPEWVNHFDSFIQPVADAVAAHDTDFFVSRALESTTVCQAVTNLLQCAGKPEGTTFRGLPESISDGSRPTVEVPLAEYRDQLNAWWAAALPGQTDQFGTGEPRLFGFAVVDNGVGDLLMPLVSEIVDTGTPAGIQRQTRAFTFILPNNAGDLDMYLERLIVSSADSSKWLSGTCAECYHYWQPWQGATN